MQKAGFTRRNFLKTSAAVSAATVVANLGTNFAHAAGSDVIKVGVIGCGGRGNGAADNCVEGGELAGAKVQIAAAGDVFKDATNHLKNKYKLPDDKCFDGLDCHKGVVDSGVDMVLICTPPGFKPLQFEYAIEKGKHVFIEKPVAVCPAGVRVMLKAGEMATEKKLGVVAGTQRRHETNYIDTIKAIHDGAIGDVLHMSIYWCGGGIWWRNPKPGMSPVEAQINNWYHHIWLSGDQICEQHLHNVDVANWVLGSHPVSAYGQGGRNAKMRPEGSEIWDNTAVEFIYPNGARVLSFGRHWPGDGDVSEFAIGSNGTSNPGGWIAPKGGQRKSFRNQRSGYVQEHVDLIKSILDGKPLNETKAVTESTMATIIGRMSCYSGKKVSWDWAMKESKLDLLPRNLDLKGPAPKVEIPIPDGKLV